MYRERVICRVLGARVFWVELSVRIPRRRSIPTGARYQHELSVVATVEEPWATNDIAAFFTISLVGTY